MATRKGLRGTRSVAGDDALRFIIPTGDHYTIVAADIPENPGYIDLEALFPDCRVIYADVSGYVKIGYLSGKDQSQKYEVLTVETGFKQITSVNRIYRYYTGTTAMTTQVMRDDGTGPVAGVKVRK